MMGACLASADLQLDPLHFSGDGGGRGILIYFSLLCGGKAQPQ